MMIINSLACYIHFISATTGSFGTRRGTARAWCTAGQWDIHACAVGCSVEIRLGATSTDRSEML